MFKILLVERWDRKEDGDTDLIKEDKTETSKEANKNLANNPSERGVPHKIKNFMGKIYDSI